MPQITTAEYEQRLQRLQTKLAAHELEAFLVSSRENIHYFCHGAAMGLTLSLKPPLLWQAETPSDSGLPREVPWGP